MVELCQLFLTTQCSLKCKYCFVSKFTSKHETMSLENADKIIRFVSSKLPEGVSIELFGGEPLLAFDVIKKFLELRPNFNYFIPTNCMNLDEEKYEFLKKHGEFIGLTLSIDGEPETQLANRGQVPNMDMVKRVLRELPRTIVRMVVEDPSKLYSDLKFVVSLGTTSVAIGIPYIYKNRDGYKGIFLEQMKKVKEDPALKHINIRVDATACESRCQAGREYISISPTGDIYPCAIWYLKGMFKIGDIVNGIDEVKQAEFFKETDPYMDKEVPCIAQRYFLGDKWING